MKKIVTSFACAAVIAASVSADFLRVEMGGGTFMQTPKTSAHYEGGDGVLDLSGDYKGDESSQNEIYAWAYIKHPLPLVPNIRVEYLTLSDEGKTTGTVNGTYTASESPTTVDMTEFSVTPYYNLLDNTFWLTLDVGLDIKFIKTDAEVTDLRLGTGALSVSTGYKYSSSENVVVPLLYARTRAQLPLSGLGAEAALSYITDGDSSVYDIRAKIDYTFESIPVVQPGIEVGYRMQKFDLKDGKDYADFEYSGVYVGGMLRF